LRVQAGMGVRKVDDLASRGLTQRYRSCHRGSLSKRTSANDFAC
jgi:hypothetical protein